MQYLLDLRQYRCPLPLLMTKRALEQLKTNDELLLQLNPQSAVQDFHIFCQQNQYELQQLSATQLKICKKI